MNFIHKLEPLWWMLFGGGGFVASFFLPGLLMGVCLFAPLGLFESGLRYERAYALASSGVGRIFLGGVISLTLWHCAHHLRHLGLDSVWAWVPRSRRSPPTASPSSAPSSRSPSSRLSSPRSKAPGSLDAVHGHRPLN